MSSIGYATLQVIPSMKDIGTTISSSLGAPLIAAGNKAGQDVGNAFANALASQKSNVEKISAQLAAARNKEADASGKVRVAEAQLQSMRDRGVTDAGRLAVAEEKVNKARRDSATASEKAKSTDAALASAKDRAKDAANKLADAEAKAASGASQLGSASRSAGDDVDAMGKKTAGAGGELSRLGSIAAAGAGLAAVGAAAIGVGKSLLGVGETFANVKKTLTFTTGATGKELDDMNESVKNIGKTMPKSFDDIAGTLAKVAQRTDLVGAPLEKLTRQVLKVNGMMGEDVDINQLTGAFAAFGVSGDQASDSMDALFKVARSTGVGINELAAAAVKGAPQFQEFGYSLAESAALMGSLDKAGLNSDAVLTGLNKALVAFAKAGKDPKAALNDTISSIEQFTKAGNTAGAVDVASKLFGTKGAGQFVNAVKSGAISVESLTSAMDAGQKGILDAGGAIPSLSSAWTLFKNNILVAIEPVATKIFGIFIDGLTWFRTTGVTIIGAVTGAFSGILGGGALDGIQSIFGKIRDGATGVLSILTKGDFAGAAVTFGLDEDSPIVDMLFNIRQTAIDVFTEVTGGIRAFIAAFRDGGDEVTSSGFAGFLEQLGVYARDLADIFNTYLMPVIKVVGSILLDVGTAAIPVLFDAAVRLKDILIGLGEAVFTVINFFKEHKDVALGLGVIIGTALLPALLTMTATLAAQTIEWLANAAATASYYLTLNGIGIATRAWAAGQWLLNAAMDANPIGLIVLALTALVTAIVLAYRNSETFRDIVQSAFSGIETAISFAWNSVILPVLRAFGTAFDVVGEAVMAFWHTSIEPAFTAIKFIFDLWWAGVQINFKVFQIAVEAMGAVIMWLWHNAFEPAMHGIGFVLDAAYNGLILPFIDNVKQSISLLGDAVMWLWHNVFEPALDGIGDSISGAYNGVILPIFNYFNDGVHGLGDVLTWLWHEIAEPVMDGFGKSISAAWNFIEPILSNIGDGIHAIGDIASEIGFILKGAFDGVVDIIKEPLRVIGGLLSRIPTSILGVDIPGTGTLHEWGEKLEGLRSGGVVGGAARSRDGVLSGPGTGTSDSILGVDATGVPIVRVSKGEGVVKESAMEGGGTELVAALNAGWTPSASTLATMFPDLPRRADGGVIDMLGGGTVNASIWKRISEKFPDATLNSGYRAGDSGFHGIKKAIDVGGPMQQIADFAFNDLRNDLAQIIWNAGPVWYNVKKNELGNGVATASGAEARSIYGEATMAEHSDHVHLAAEDVLPDPAAPTPAPAPAPQATSPSAPKAKPSTGSGSSDSTSEAKGSGQRLKTFQELGSDLGGILAGGLLETFGLQDSFLADPNKLLQGDDGSNVRTSDSNSGASTSASGTASTDPVQPSIPAGQDGAAPAPDRRGSLSGSDLYSYDITSAAKDLGLPEMAATIGNAAGLVETELKMFANSTVPESLQFPHDGVGSNGSSLGVLQQQDSWGSVSDRMNSRKSADLFFDALQGISGWESMDPGAAAQSVQRSAYPDKYSTRMVEAKDWVQKAGLYDTGGFLPPGGVAVSMLTKPEPLLPSHRWETAAGNIDAADHLVKTLERQSDSRSGDTYNAYGYTAGDIATEWARLNYARSGTYGGRGR